MELTRGSRSHFRDGLTNAIYKLENHAADSSRPASRGGASLHGFDGRPIRAAWNAGDL
jgi:hypothetical protein